MIKVLFVCLGNICRSPTAEAVFHHLLVQNGLTAYIQIDSAGTSGWHTGEPPDLRSQEEALRRGIDMSHQRSRAVASEDFTQFDYIVAMDQDNLRALKKSCPNGQAHRLHRCTAFAPHVNVRDVPDPYYGGPNGFKQVFDIIEASVEGLLAEIKVQHHLGK